MSDQGHSLSGVIALTKITDHEKVCAERYASIEANFGDIKKLVFSILLGVIGMLLTALGGVVWTVVSMNIHNS